MKRALTRILYGSVLIFSIAICLLILAIVGIGLGWLMKSGAIIGYLIAGGLFLAVAHWVGTPFESAYLKARDKASSKS